ncbi:MAG: DUF502 domain-containing protein, partial [Ketobacteraceae bacterium]|nr:DUF502 domain-containing protein [Ketobacteraceae bacterium]
MTDNNGSGFLKKTIIGGLVVLLPIGIVLMITQWLFRVITDLIQPLTNIITTHSVVPEIIGDAIVILLLLVASFLVGWVVTTGLGNWFHARFDHILTKLTPGYRLVREIVMQFLGDDESSPFTNGEVALVRIFGAENDVRITALVTSKSEEYYTIMLPTCPNPTSGLSYHVPRELVELRPDIPVDSAMRTIIACGA